MQAHNVVSIAVSLVLLAASLAVGVRYITPPHAAYSPCPAPMVFVNNRCCAHVNQYGVCDTQVNTTSTHLTLEQSANEQQENLSHVSPEGANAHAALVTDVPDGQTLILASGQRVRLAGISAPQHGEQFWFASRNHLQSLVNGTAVLIVPDGYAADNAGSEIAQVFVDSRNVNILMLEDGYADLSTQYPTNHYADVFKQAKLSALRRKIGMWTPPAALTTQYCDDSCVQVATFRYDTFTDDCTHLNDEYVRLQNVCSHDCNLTGWTLANSGIARFTLPPFVLGSHYSVTVHSGAGKNNATDLFWDNRIGQCRAVWNNAGDTLYAYNIDGQLVMRYSYLGR